MNAPIATTAPANGPALRLFSPHEDPSPDIGAPLLHPRPPTPDPQPSWRLRDFFTHWHTVHVFGRQETPPDPATLRGWRETLAWWERLTGDPPLGEIGDGHVTRLVAGLREAPGRRDATLAVSTRRKHLVRLRALLVAAGPRGPGRLAAGLIGPLVVPAPAAAPAKEPEALELDDLRALYAAAGRMRTPAVWGIEPAWWWRAFVVTGYSTALRIKTLVSLRWEWIDDRGVARIPREAMKRKARGHQVRLSVEALAHLHKIRIGHPTCLTWPGSERRLFAGVRSLFDRAGLDQKWTHTCHSLRRTHGTYLAEDSPLAASLSLGHAVKDLKVLRDHYADPRRLVEKALAKLPSFLPAEPEEVQLTLF